MAAERPSARARQDLLENFVNPWLPVPGTKKKQPPVKRKIPRYFNSEDAPSESQQLPSSSFSKSRHGAARKQQSALGKNNWSDVIYEGPASVEPSEEEEEEQNKEPDEYEKHLNSLRNTLDQKDVREKDTEFDAKRIKRYLRETVKVDRTAEEGGPIRVEKYPGSAPIEPERLERHSRGSGVDTKWVRSKVQQVLLDNREAVVEEALEHGARAEVMLTENEGYLEAEEGERTVLFSQRKIANAVDITTASKYFDLSLDKLGPYRMDYNRSGRYLLLGGRKGHIAAMDWTSKDLLCEFNVREEVFAVKWLHFETMFAVAQKRAVFVYDNTGCEIHCLKQLSASLHLEFLPYHFLLASMNANTELSWLDISIGKMVRQLKTQCGHPASMTQNPTNAVICVGHQGGHLTMWTPNVSKPVLKMLCHKHPLHALAIDHRGMYMATAASSRVKIWDLRSLKGCVQEYKLRSAAKSLSISQRGLLAMGMGNVVEVYRNCLSETADQAYMRHTMQLTQTSNLQFCPYEDILGVAHTKGFSSLIIPGSGEPNYDGLEVNPYQTRSQRKEAEVKALLEKIQPHFITYDPSIIATVNVPTMVEKLHEAEERAVRVPRNISLSHRKGGNKGTAKAQKAKEIMYEGARQKFVKEKMRKQLEKEKKDEETNIKWTQEEGVSAVLDRFQWQRK